jgi:hypothetical protein
VASEPDGGQSLDEAELNECHQTYRATTDQAIKTIAFLAAANAVLLSVTVEQQRALAIGATALIPAVGIIIAAYLGRQFGAAVRRGAALEYALRGKADGFFWMHLRSANRSSADGLEKHLAATWGASTVPEASIAAQYVDATPLIAAPVRSLKWIAILELLLMPVLISASDWTLA